MINVTQPFLPPKEEYQRYVDKIWDRNWLTNNGPLVNEFELKIKDFLNIKHLLYVSNGTIALQLAIKALDLKGEIITTPFSYVATTSSIAWESCTPVFVDIDESTFNIDPSKIEEAITSETSAILATHVYGNPCEVDKIDVIAKKYNLKVIYDAAHCFGTTYKGKSILEYGDISTISFHATKLFHTTEGGGVVTKKPDLLKRLAYLRNFGHNGKEEFYGIGINGKNSEFHAAMGLSNLKYAKHILQKREKDFQFYLKKLKGFEYKQPRVINEAKSNFAYFPICFSSVEECKLVLQELEKAKIFARRYFYPLLSKLNYVESNDMPIAEDISSKVLCLPLYEQITEEEIEMICRIIKRTIKYK